MTLAELQELWTQLKRFRGTPPNKVAEYFHPDCVIAYLATGRVYAGFTQVEQLMASHRDSFHFISETEVLSSCYDPLNLAIVEESRIKVNHARQIDWLAPGLKSTSNELDLNICTATVLKDGKIWRQRVYWDNALVLKAFKVLPGSVPAVADLRVAEAVSAAFGAAKQQPPVAANNDTAAPVKSVPDLRANSARGFKVGPALPQNTSVKVLQNPGGKSSISFG